MQNALYADFPSHSQLLKKNVELEGENSCCGELSWAGWKREHPQMGLAGGREGIVYPVGHPKMPRLERGPPDPKRKAENLQG